MQNNLHQALAYCTSCTLAKKMLNMIWVRLKSCLLLSHSVRMLSSHWRLLDSHACVRRQRGMCMWKAREEPLLHRTTAELSVPRVNSARRQKITASLQNPHSGGTKRPITLCFPSHRCSPLPFITTQAEGLCSWQNSNYCLSKGTL